MGYNMVQAGCRCRDNRWSLLGMTALVTGGTQGIGHAVVEELAGLGAKVHTCSRNEANLNACLHDWEKNGFEVISSVCDVMSRGERVKLMDTVSSVFCRRLNILALNDEQFSKSVNARTPLGLPGEPNKVSSLVAFLCLPASSYITSQIICGWRGGSEWLPPKT